MGRIGRITEHRITENRRGDRGGVIPSFCNVLMVNRCWLDLSSAVVYN